MTFRIPECHSSLIAVSDQKVIMHGTYITNSGFNISSHKHLTIFQWVKHLDTVIIPWTLTERSVGQKHNMSN